MCASKRHKYKRELRLTLTPSTQFVISMSLPKSVRLAIAASAVDNATDFCCREDHMIAAPNNMMMDQMWNDGWTVGWQSLRLHNLAGHGTSYGRTLNHRNGWCEGMAQHALLRACDRGMG